MLLIRLHRDTLADELVDISPQELHHQHKLADEERSHEQQHELLNHEYVELLDSEHPNSLFYMPEHTPTHVIGCKVTNK